MDHWCRTRALERGAVITVDQCWRLSQRWYRGRQELHWTPPSAEEMEAVFAEAGLVGEFWRLGGA